MNKIEENNTEKQLMERFGIKAEQRTVYWYKEYRYERLEDALAYVKLELKRQEAGPGQ